MALQFQGKQPVEFGGRNCIPEINTEMKMRLSQIQSYDEETDKILASAFPKDEAYVLKFLKNDMTHFEKQELHAYLLGGMKMVDSLNDEVKKVFHDMFAEVKGKTNEN